MKRLILASLCVLVAASTASGSSAVGTPYKWLQYPDLASTGIDVDSTNTTRLADDFRCTSTGYITGLQIWGSWKDDRLPYGSAAGASGDASAVMFRVSIYSDIPDTDGTGPLYSMPNDVDVLWQRDFAQGEFAVQNYTEALEDWYDPKTGQYLPQNHNGVWLYSFIAPPDVDPCDLFYQEEDTVYWLGIEAFPADTSATFGWKTSLDHWNDDAVFWQPAASWHELKYPDGHSMYPQSIDLAFGIVPEPATLALLGLGSLITLRKRRA